MVYCWFWFTIIIIAVIAEILTERLISIWLIPGAIFASTLDFFSISLSWQIISLIAISLSGILIVRRLVLKSPKREKSQNNLDAIIGERCIVTERIDNFAGCGQVKVKGQIWSARGVAEDDTFENGEALHVVAIEGVKLICKK